MDWYYLSLIALLCFGVQNFLYKVSVEKKCNTAWTTSSFMLTVAILSSILFFVLKESISNLSLLLLISLISAISFSTATITRIESLKYIPTNISFPIIRLGLVIVVIFSMIYFKDNLSVYQILGIILAIITLIILTKNDKKKTNNKKFGIGIILALIALISQAATTIILKFASIMVNKLGYIAISYIFNTFFSFGLRKKLQTKKENPKQINAIILGIIIGIINFIGFFTIIKAYSIGPLSLVASINSMSFIIAIILSIIIYKEKITKRSILGIILSIIAMILLRM